MTLSQIRRRVDALTRKFSTELAVCRLRPAANEYCDQWEELVAENSLPPNPRRLLKKILGKDCLRRRFPAVNSYLELCRIGRSLPHPNQILALFFPGATSLGIVPVPRPSVCY